jgi:hypothetical protein
LQAKDTVHLLQVLQMKSQCQHDLVLLFHFETTLVEKIADGEHHKVMQVTLLDSLQGKSGENILSRLPIQIHRVKIHH